MTLWLASDQVLQAPPTAAFAKQGHTLLDQVGLHAESNLYLHRGCISFIHEGVPISDPQLRHQVMRRAGLQGKGADDWVKC